MSDMTYDGTRLTWNKKSYKASSGLKEFVNPETGELADQRVAKYQKYENGPLPEGTYSVPIYLNGTATVVNKFTPVDPATNKPLNAQDCEIAATITGGLQKLPEKGQGNCKTYRYPGWGTQRIRLYKQKIKWPKRDNFYLHDSTKGYSHGCVEVEGSFFEDLQSIFHTDFLKGKKHTLTLEVHYPSPDTVTIGGTEK
jgi:hypothetical protein